MTTPIAEPAKATSGRDFDPTSSSCRINSRHSNGGVTAALRTCQEKMPRLPNHSKNPLNTFVAEIATADRTPVRGSGRGGLPAAVVNPGALTAWGLSLERRTNGSNAYAIAQAACLPDLHTAVVRRSRVRISSWMIASTSLLTALHTPASPQSATVQSSNAPQDVGRYEPQRMVIIARSRRWLIYCPVGTPNDHVRPALLDNYRNRAELIRRVFREKAMMDRE